MNPRPLTRAERRALSKAINDGGEIIIGGSNRTRPSVRWDVINRLFALGYFVSKPAHYRMRENIFSLTDKGRQAQRTGAHVE